ncbi:Hsp20/alpha crystallin family protein [Natronolimnobius sp. AArcel1]|uniref:Hsp20/alpha crystallin family protein n=1 Tax=Natronolimnobius sp. AArcel1 TaxID=1679093 RepID=UPI0013EBE607|nr:Hsp20/alpha crystallin family protein [Natronolimnobius sp. AArcel1]NGM68006.1 Hsp20/alpha crystallin family protein [Natronolimnobius sp. AArcel1]
MSALRDALRTLSDDVFFDLLESDEAYLLILDVPGISADSLDLTAEDSHLEISAQREKALPEEYQYIEETRSLFFDVELPLPADTLPAEAQATVERGVLELSIPKRTGGTETTIDIVDADDAETGGTTITAEPGQVHASESETETEIDPETDTDTTTESG